MERRKIAIVGWTLIWGGLFIFGYLGWQLLGTDVLNARVQAEAAETLDRHLEVAAEEPVVVEVVEEEAEGEEGSEVEHFQEAPPTEDEGFARISVPSLDLEAVVFEGVSSATLAKGPGHMPGTPIPGQPGNSVISGHRTTYGRPFYDFDPWLPAIGSRSRPASGSTCTRCASRSWSRPPTSGSPTTNREHG